MLAERLTGPVRENVADANDASGGIDGSWASNAGGDNVGFGEVRAAGRAADGASCRCQSVSGGHLCRDPLGVAGSCEAGEVGHGDGVAADVDTDHVGGLVSKRESAGGSATVAAGWMVAMTGPHPIRSSAIASIVGRDRPVARCSPVSPCGSDSRRTCSTDSVLPCRNSAVVLAPVRIASPWNA